MPSIEENYAALQDNWDPLVHAMPVRGETGTPIVSRIESPEWWRDRMHKELTRRGRALSVLDDYYVGRHPLAFASKKFREAFGGLFREFADNWCSLVVDAVEERLDVGGFRLVEDPSRPSSRLDRTGGDQKAWALWQANGLDEGSQIAHLEALICGVSYGLVWPGTGTYPEITIEHPRQMITANRPGTRQIAAAYKEWRDDWTGRLMCTLYLPDRVYKWQTREPAVSTVGESTRLDWVQRMGDEDEEWGFNNPLGVVPVVPIRNRPRLLDECDSEIRQVIPIQDAVNKTLADALVASEFQAYRQRWATGLDIPIDPATNQPVEPIKAAVERLWVAKSAETKFGDFAEVKLENFVVMLDKLAQDMATITRTPPHYFFLRGSFPSGESIKAAETGLVAKVRRRQRWFGGAWEEIIRLAFLAADDSERAQAFASETLWEDPESRSESEHIDAVVKRKQLGVPDRQLQEDAGYSMQQIERFEEMGGGETPPPPSEEA